MKLKSLKIIVSVNNPEFEQPIIKKVIRTEPEMFDSVKISNS